MLHNSNFDTSRISLRYHQPSSPVAISTSWPDVACPSFWVPEGLPLFLCRTESESMHLGLPLFSGAGSGAVSPTMLVIIACGGGSIFSGLIGMLKILRLRWRHISDSCLFVKHLRLLIVSSVQSDSSTNSPSTFVRAAFPSSTSFLNKMLCTTWPKFMQLGILESTFTTLPAKYEVILKHRKKKVWCALCCSKQHARLIEPQKKIRKFIQVFGPVT